MNESLLGVKDSGRVVFGLQVGNYIHPKEYAQTKTPVPMDVPRVRYELLTRRVGNTAPVANAGPDQVGVAAGTVTLDGSGSYDPDGDAITYQWSQIGGTAVTLSAPTAATTTFTAAAGQTYVFRLTVTDSGGLTSNRHHARHRRQPVVGSGRALRRDSQPDHDRTAILADLGCARREQRFHRQRRG